MKIIFLTIFILAMKLGWQVVDQPQFPIKVDVMDDLQSLWEVEAINSSKPFQYHLEIDN